MKKRTISNTGNDYIVENPDSESLTASVVNLNNPPRVSFCIPTFNSEDTLQACLESIKSQSYPNFEIIVVDNGSSDDTLAIAEKYTDKIFHDDGPLGSVRKTSVEHATGQILGLFDSDIILPHDQWLTKAVRYFNYSDDVGTVWPKNIAPPNGSVTTKMYFNYWQIVIEDRIRKNRGLFGGGNALFRRDVIEDIGGIDSSKHYIEDYDWAKKLKEGGYSVVYLYEPIYHDTMRSFVEIIEKQFMAIGIIRDEGVDVMGLTFMDQLYEHIILGTLGMIRGLFVEKDYSWALYPLLVVTRMLAYVYIMIQGSFNDKFDDNI